MPSWLLLLLQMGMRACSLQGCYCAFPFHAPRSPFLFPRGFLLVVVLLNSALDVELVMKWVGRGWGTHMTVHSHRTQLLGLSLRNDQLSSSFVTLRSPILTDTHENSSICTGALFLGTLGIFDGRFCTTHWGSFDLLKQNVQEGAKRTGSGRPGTVVAARFVDSVSILSSC